MEKFREWESYKEGHMMMMGGGGGEGRVHTSIDAK